MHGGEMKDRSQEVSIATYGTITELRKHSKHFKQLSSAAISLLVFSSFSIQAWPQKRSQLLGLHGLGGQACIDRQLESKWTTFRSAVDTDTTRSRLIDAERCWKLWFCLFWDSVEDQCSSLQDQAKCRPSLAKVQTKFVPCVNQVHTSLAPSLDQVQIKCGASLDHCWTKCIPCLDQAFALFRLCLQRV